MSVRFDKLIESIRSLGEAAANRRDSSSQLIDHLLHKLTRHRTNWGGIERALDRALGVVDWQKYRAARPLGRNEPLDLGIAPPPPPAQATLVVVDGSQALPSRHAPFPYYLINIGWLVYPHGSAEPPREFSEPQLFYEGDGRTDADAAFRSSAVGIQRDMAEIERLALATAEYRAAPRPLLALLDQRLQYWPIGVDDHAAGAQYVREWIGGMERVQAADGWLAGYIERPETGAVVTLLYTLDLDTPDGRPELLNERPPVDDATLYRRVLQPGERSCLYEVVNRSTGYAPYMDAGQEIAFFYYKPPRGDEIARVDLPTRLARRPEVAQQVHALIHTQCSLLGGYPYALTRADEAAVVTRSDQEYLDHLVLLELERHGIDARSTAKQFGKDLTRAGRAQHKL